MDWTTLLCGKKPAALKGRGTETNPDGGYGPMLGAWLIEMALFFDWCKPFRRLNTRSFNARTSNGWPEIFHEENFLALTGIPSAEDLAEDGVKPDSRRLRTILRKRKALLAKIPPPENPSLLENVDMLGNMLGLGEVDRAILVFAASYKLFQRFNDAVDEGQPYVTNQALWGFLSNVTGFPEPEIRDALSDAGILAKTGIVRVDRKKTDLSGKLELFDGLTPFLLQTNLTPDVLVSRLLQLVPAPRFSTSDFPHLAGDTEVLRAYLRNAVAWKVEGVNILFHGKPGVGKTEYARAIAAEIGADLYEIASSGDEGESLKGEARFQSFRLCQSLLSKSPNVILLIDEIEDVFPDDRASFFAIMHEDSGTSSAAAGKAWVRSTSPGAERQNRSTPSTPTSSGEARKRVCPSRSYSPCPGRRNPTSNGFTAGVSDHDPVHFFTWLYVSVC